MYDGGNMIDFNSKFFKILSLVFLIYLVYLVVEERRSQTVFVPNQDLPSVNAAPGAKYTIEIDPSKPASEQTFFEKTIQFLFAKKIESEVQNQQKLEQYNMSPKTENRAAINGDIVKVIIKEEGSADNVEPKLYIIGGGALDKDLEARLIGMKIGEVKDTEVNGKKYRIELLDINPVGSLNKQLNQPKGGVSD